MRLIEPCKHCGTKRAWEHKEDCPHYVPVHNNPFGKTKRVEWWDVVVNPKRYTKKKLF